MTHRACHRRLLTGPAPGIPRPPLRGLAHGLDAVVVPAFRPAPGLAHAAQVADVAGAPLVLLCSGHVSAAAAVRAVQACAPAVTVVGCDLAPGYSIPRVRLATDRHPHGLIHRLQRRHDANVKRNVGLMLARLMGWQRLLLLNDDVRGVGSAELGLTLRMLDRPGAGLHAVGWAFPAFPDNSVVCHANRAAGGEQGTFVSDALLAVRCGRDLPFFPPVYNEDWLFLIPLIMRRQLGFGGDLWQMPYDPFQDAARARYEEFGDVLGEGLMGLLHQDGSLDRAGDATFWREQLGVRRHLLYTVETGLRRRRAVPGHRPGPAAASAPATMLRSVGIARDSHRPDWPEQLAGFVRLWQRDLGHWGQVLDSLRPVRDLGSALAVLGLRAADREGGMALRA